jgi:molybdate transport system permease protein
MPSRIHRAKSDLPFHAAVFGFTGFFVLLIIALLVGNASFAEIDDFKKALEDDTILAAIRLSLVTCTITALLSLLVAVPVGYALSRYRFPGRTIVDAIIDVPIVLPPLVVGISLLILFNQTVPGQAVESWFVGVVAWLNGVVPWLMEFLGLSQIRGITYDVPAIILGQFMVASAFAVRTMRVTFDQIDPRQERVALTLGCSRGQAFRRVVLPEARRGMVAATTLAWARAMGEFGPILVFAGATSMKTEVIPTKIWLELSTGEIESAVAISLLMVAMALFILVVARAFGLWDGSAWEHR